MSSLHRLLLVLACAGLSLFPAPGRAQAYDAAQLEPLLAPVALYPDAVLDEVLIASTVPDEVAAAAQWTRANPGMTPADAQNAVQSESWQPAVKALVGQPELLQNMADSPQWLTDLASAYLTQPDDVAATVQVLRERAYASGTLRSDAQQYVIASGGGGIAVLPAVPGVLWVRYYDPWLAFGPQWRPAYRPIHWRPWAPRPVFVNRIVVDRTLVRPVPHRIVPPRHDARRHEAPPNHAASPAARMQAAQSHAFRERARMQNRPSPAVRMQRSHGPAVTPYHRVPESRRQSIFRSVARPPGK